MRATSGASATRAAGGWRDHVRRRVPPVTGTAGLLQSLHPYASLATSALIDRCSSSGTEAVLRDSPCADRSEQRNRDSRWNGRAVRSSTGRGDEVRPQAALQATAIHIAAIASEAHISRTWSSSNQLCSGVDRAGGCETLDKALLLSESRLAGPRPGGIRDETVRGCLKVRIAATADEAGDPGRSPDDERRRSVTGQTAGVEACRVCLRGRVPTAVILVASAGERPALLRSPRGTGRRSAHPDRAPRK